VSTGLDQKPKDIFCVQIQNKYLVYAPPQRLSALLNRAAAKALRAGLRGETPLEGELGELGKALQAEGEPIPTLRSGALSDPFFLGLIPTRGCNLDCQYCDFAAPKLSSPQMSLETVRGAIDAYIQVLHVCRKTRLEVHFFGGEPFYAPEAVFFAVEYARMQAAQQGLETCFEVITNGMFNTDLARWIGSHFDTVVLSLDGFEEIHERQRPALKQHATYPIILRNAHVLAESEAELALRVCITRENVSQMAAFAGWAAEELHPGSVCFETLAESPLSRQNGLEAADPYQFVQNFQAARKVLEAQGIQTILSTDPPGSLQSSFCPVGKDALIVSPDGTLEACYWLEAAWQRNGLDLRLGRLEGDHFVLDPDAVGRAREATLINKDGCQNCLALHSCAGGCHVRRAGSPAGRRYAEVCFQTRLILTLRLLHELGQDSLAEAWLADRSAVERFVYTGSDRLESLEALA
jgi:radical SAM protein with 4Fe4S-binding SPASM domain